MFQKKYKQFLAATLSVAMLFGQAQYVRAAEDMENVIELSEEESFELAPEVTEPELSVEDIQEYIEDTEGEDFEFIGTTIDEEASEGSLDEEFYGDATEETELLDETSDEEVEEADLEEVVADTLDAELPQGVVGMAEDYELTGSELSIKADAIAKKDTYFNDFASLTEGEDYAKDEVVFLAETKEHAEEVAAAYAGTVKSFENGVAVIDLSESEVSVEEAYSCAFVENSNLPVVTPNYFFAADDLTQVDDEYLGSQKVNPSEETTEENTSEEVSEEASKANVESDAAEAKEDAAEDGEETSLISTGVVVADEDENADGFLPEAVTEEDNFVNEPYLDATVNEYQWHHNMIDSYSAFMELGRDGISKTSEVVVAVIDDGVADIAELNVTGDVDVEGNHGTLVAGVIGAALDENAGAGVAPGVQLLSLKTDYTAASVMTQLREAASMNVNVINMSFGGSNIDPQLQSVVDEVNASGVILVASVGEGVSYPAACENVIAVVSVNEAGKVSSFVTDASYADIAAPGSNIWTTDVDGSYVMVSGSALASSVVAGAAALYIAQNGSVAPEVFKAALVDSAVAKDEISVINVRNLLNSATFDFGGADTNVKAGNKAKKIKIHHLTSGRADADPIKKYTIGIVGSGSINTKESFTAYADNGAPITWSASKSALKKISYKQSGNSVTVWVNDSNVKPGTVKLTAAAPGKKVTLSIKIINPVSKNLKFECPFPFPATSDRNSSGDWVKTQYYNRLANGGSFKIKPNVIGANDKKKPTNKKLKWGVVVAVSDGKNVTTLDKKYNKNVASASGGKVSAKSGAWKWLEKKGYVAAAIYPYAQTTDGTNIAWYFENLNDGSHPWCLQLTWKPKGPFGFRSGATYDILKSAGTQPYNQFTYTVRRGWVVISKTTSYIECYSPFYVESNHPEILTVECRAVDTDPKKGTVYCIMFTPKKYGTARITIKTKDGTNYTSTAYFKVG